MAPFKIRHLEKFVSVFVFLALFFLATMGIFLAKQKKIFSKKKNFYTVIQSIEKIEPGMEVILRGPNVPIGKIDGFSITKNNEVRIDFFIYQEYEERIRENSVIVFSAPLLGIIGNFKIEITSGDAYYPMVKKDDIVPSNQMMEGIFLLSMQKKEKDEEEIPLISKLNPLLDNLTTNLDPKGPLMSNITSLLYHLNIFTLQLNQGGVFSVMGSPALKSNLERMTENINYLLASSDSLVNNNVKAVLNDVNVLLHNLKRTTDTVNYNLPKTLSSLNAIMFRLEKIVSNLESSPLLGGGSYNKQKKEDDSRRLFQAQ